MALQTREALSKRVPVMVTGQDRSGKTSLIKSLMGRLFDPSEDSTVGIEVDPRHFEVSVDAWKAWETADSTEQEASLRHIIVEAMKDEATQGTKSLQFDRILEETASLFDRVLQKSEDTREEPSVFADLWDFGGNFLYSVYPVFFTPKAIYLMVFDLSQNMHARAERVVKQGTYMNILDNQEAKTNLDCLDFWMTSVASLAGEDDDQHFPSVFLVCTHADMPYGGADPFQIARSILCYLKTKPYKNKLYDDVFVVDNTESECYEVVRLRQRILEAGMELSKLKGTIPIRWLKFEMALQEIKREGFKWISLDQAKQIATEVCEIDSAYEFPNMMNFFHDQRSLIHFNGSPVLDNLVVIDCSWLVHVFGKVITLGVKPYESQESEEMWIMRRRIDSTGIVHRELLEYVWGSFLDQELFSSLLAIMEKFGLLCSLPSSDPTCGQQFLVPSVLRTYPTHDNITLAASARFPSLFLNFQYGRVPLGLFSRLVLHFFQWGQDHFWNPKNIKLHRNFAQFYLAADDGYSVILHCHTSSIEVSVHRGNFSDDLSNNFNGSADARFDGFEVACARSVRKQLELILKCMSDEFPWLKIKYQVGFICSVCCKGHRVKFCNTHHKKGCEQKECLHFYSERDLLGSKQFITCQRSTWTSDDDRCHIKQFAFWIESFNEQVEIDENEERPSALSKLVIPSEINVRGRLALESYNKALKEGKTRARRVPIMLIGKDHSGKTSLKNSLIGKSFNRNESSTLGIDVGPSHFKVTTEIWNLGGTSKKNQAVNNLEALSFEYHAARLVVDDLKEEKKGAKSMQFGNSQSDEASSLDLPSLRMHETAKLPLDDASKTYSTGSSKDAADSIQHSEDPQFNDGRRITEASFAHVGPQKNENLSTNALSEIPGEVIELIKKLLRDEEEDRDDGGVYSVLWDFGGQSVYYATHPLFLTRKAVYLLVYDLSQGLHARAEPVVKQGMYKQFLDNHDAKTNLDYLDFWMTSVASLANQDNIQHVSLEQSPVNVPPVFLVCTHADEPCGGADPSAFALEVFGSLRTKPYRNQLYNGVFSVDNTKSGGGSECSEVQRLRETVLAVAKELPQLKEDIPIKWLKFEKALQRTVKEGKNWISLEMAKRIASEVCKIEDDKTFSTLLNFLHDQRILIHFEDSSLLKNIVFLDLQWLVYVFKSVITVKPGPYDKEEAEFEELWCRLQLEGILEQKLLEHEWKRLSIKKELFASLLKIMEKLSLLCPLPSSVTSSDKQYLVPSMLTSLPPKEVMEFVSSAQIPPLSFKFKTSQVPPGLFPRLVLQFFQWGQGKFWRSEKPQLHHNFAQFYTSEDEDCSVILLCHFSCIEVVVLRENCFALSEEVHFDAFEVHCAYTVRRQLVLILERMRNEFCWLKNMKYEEEFICLVCCPGRAAKYSCTHQPQNCEQEECLHFWPKSNVYSAKNFDKCKRWPPAKRKEVCIKHFAYWFGAPREEVK